MFEAWDSWSERDVVYVTNSSYQNRYDRKEGGGGGDSKSSHKTYFKLMLKLILNLS